MAYTNLGYGGMIPWPVKQDITSQMGNVSATNLTIDAANEVVYFVGQLQLPSGVSSVTANTTTTIGFRLGGSTFAHAGGTTLRVGIQDVDASTGVPARGDGTFDVYADYVSGTDTLTQNAWNTITMETGSKTINNGQLIAVAFLLTARDGADSVAISASQVSASYARPVVSSDLGSGVTARLVIPTIAFNFNGTWATLSGADTHIGYTTGTFNSTSTGDERGNLFTLPVTAKCAGVYFRRLFAASSATCSVIIYSDPLGTPAAISGATVTVDSDTLGSTGAGDGLVMFDSPIELTAGTEYAVVLKPGDSTNWSHAYLDYADTNTVSLSLGGANFTWCQRTDYTGAFTETNTRKMALHLVLSDIDIPSGGSSPRIGDRTGGLR
jgi:hypothetical protein